MLFGGRRSTVVPLVYEAFDWEHGVFVGATMSSETTAAAVGKVGKLRFDPFAMLPFCGYHMADYFEHWLEIGRRAEPGKLPRIFHVNWFRKDEDGHFLWPGYGENSRVLEWIFRRCAGDADAHATALGLVPAPGDLYTGGLDVPAEDLDAVLTVDDDELRDQLPQLGEHGEVLGDRLASDAQRGREFSRRCAAARADLAHDRAARGVGQRGEHVMAGGHAPARANGPTGASRTVTRVPSGTATRRSSTREPGSPSSHHQNTRRSARSASSTTASRSPSPNHCSRSSGSVRASQASSGSTGRVMSRATMELHPTIAPCATSGPGSAMSSPSSTPLL